MNASPHRHWKIFVCAGAGVFLSVSCVGGAELLFRANSKYAWIPRPSLAPSNATPARPDPRLNRTLSSRRFDYLNRLAPAPKVTISPGEGTLDHVHTLLAGKSFHLADNSPAPNARVRDRLALSRSGRVLYDTEYSTDAYGRRTTPPTAGAEPNRFLLFLGCSYTFGQGVRDGETWPARVQALAHGYRAYNFGICGSSPAEALEHLSRGKSFLRNRGVAEPEGLAIFTLIDDHVVRVLGTMDYLSRFPGERKRPMYRLEGGTLTNLGSIEAAAPFRTWLLGTLSESALLRFFGVDSPGPMTRPSS